jgi:ABC-type antimicrobial peptide transport system permease subunit
MLEQIIRMIRNRWRSNRWIALELLLVCCLLWYLADYLFVLACNCALPSYRDTSHTWQVNVARFAEGHPGFTPEAGEPGAIEADYHRLLDRIRSYPGVEAVAVSLGHSVPGTGSYWGTTYRNKADTSLTLGAQLFDIYPGEDYFGVFGYTAGKGKTPVSVTDFDWGDPQSVVLSRQAAEALFPGGGATGKRLGSSYDADVNLVVAGVVDDIKRLDVFRPTPVFYRRYALDAASIPGSVISVRSSASLVDARFLEAFREEMDNALRIGNFYLQSVVAYNDSMASLDRSLGYGNERRIRISLMLFFIVNLLLCVGGTFWYRINVRKEEIGLRIAAGSSRRRIMGLFMAEGLCLLGLVALPAMLIEYQFVRAGLIETFGRENSTLTFLPDHTLFRFLLTNGITWLVLSVSILAAIWIPARRASRMHPAEALHYE